MFKRKKYTKWIPIGINTHGPTQHLILARKCLDNGMLSFKSKKVQRRILYESVVLPPHGLINIQEQWNKLMEDDDT